MKIPYKLFYLIAAACLMASGRASAAENWSEQSWVDESNANTMMVMEAQAKFAPEAFASLGIEKYDDGIFDLEAGLYERSQASTQELIAQMREKLKTTENPKVIQDIEILIKSLQDLYETNELDHRYMLPYYNLSQTLYSGFQGLLDLRVDSERYPAALYDLSWDPNERSDQTRFYPKLVEQFKAEMETTARRLRRPEREGVASPESTELLRALGYVE